MRARPLVLSDGTTVRIEENSSDDRAVELVGLVRVIAPERPFILVARGVEAVVAETGGPERSDGDARRIAYFRAEGRDSRRFELLWSGSAGDARVAGGGRDADAPRSAAARLLAQAADGAVEAAA